jgi:hypothetical protein
MNKISKEILIGILLGDGHIRRSGANKAYITFEQSLKKKNWIFQLCSWAFTERGFKCIRLQIIWTFWP